MRYYFAGAYQRRAELAAHAALLQAAVPGTIVVSRWLFLDQTGEDAGFTADGLATPGAVTRAWAYAQRDLEDLGVCDAIVSFTGLGMRGGRHIEHGMMLDRVISDGWDGSMERIPRLIVVGPREHVFHCHPATEVYADFEAFLNAEGKPS